MQELQKNDARSFRMSLRIIEALVEAGVHKIIVSPGFRNSPLLLAAYNNSEIEVVSAVDERGAAFFALGCAKADRKAIAILCTSGTAAGNYLPAVMEAHHSHVPLVVITADRPQETIGIGANQATNQINLFANHVLEFFDLQAPNRDFDYEAHASFSVAKAVAKSLGPRPGPVHINVHLREPFLPSEEIIRALNQEEKPKRKWKIVRSSAGPSKDQLDAFLELIRASERPAFIIGPSDFSNERLEKISHFSDLTNIPIIAEPCAGFSGLGHYVPAHLIHRAESIFEKMLHGDLTPPDLVIRFGTPLISKKFSKLLKLAQPVQIVFEETGEAREPDLYPSIFFQGGTDGWLYALDHNKPTFSVNRIWVDQLKAADKSVEEAIDTHLKTHQHLTEWHFHRAFPSKTSEDAAVFLGNSMAIRDFLSVGPRTKQRHRYYYNRGLSGIDGLIATSAGLAYSAKRETHVILGDLSTLHDLSSFSILEDLRKQLSYTLWVLNNGGGEIFRIVGTSKAGGEESWFTTPKSFDLSSLAKAFRFSFHRLHTLEELKALEREKYCEMGVRIVEILVDPDSNGKVREFFKL